MTNHGREQDVNNIRDQPILIECSYQKNVKKPILEEQLIQEQ